MAEQQMNRRDAIGALAGLALAAGLARAQEAPLVWDAAELTAAGWPAGGGEVPPARLQPGAAARLAAGRRVLAGGGAIVDQPLGDGAERFSLVVYLQLERLTGQWQGVAGRDCYGGAAGDVFGLVLGPNRRWAGRCVGRAGAASVEAEAAAGWQQVALVGGDGRLRLIIDGRVVGEAALAGPLVSEPGTPFAIGSYAHGQAPFGGGIARVEWHRAPLAEDRLAADWAAWQAAHPLDDSFVFAQASDTHVTDTRSVEIVNDAVDLINAETDLAFSLWLGDLTQDSTADQMVLARLALDRLHRPRYCVRGNHDQTGGHYQQQFGPLMQRFDHAGWRFLLCDSCPGDSTPMAAEQVAWLREQLAVTPASMPLVLACHHPLMPATRSYLLAGAAEVVGLFAQHNLRAVMNGHYHGNQEQRVGEVLFTTTACCATTRTNFDRTTAKGYRRWRCAAGEIATEFVVVRDEGAAAPK